MARLLATGDSDHIVVSTGGWVDPPFSVSMWANSTNNTANCYFSISDANGADQHGITMTGSSSAESGFTNGNGVGVFTRTPSQSFAYGPSNTTDGVWHQIGGAWITNTSKYAYLDGVAGSEGTTNQSVTASNLDVIDIGRLGDSTPNWHFDGSVAEFGAWDVELTAGEWAALGAGVSPLLIRPESLMYYLPLMGSASPEQELITGTGGTLTGTSKSPHPAIIQPSSQILQFPTPAAAASGVFPILRPQIVRAALT